MSKDSFFIGWGETPKIDRRFFLGAGVGLLAGTAGIAAGLSATQNPGGPGTWDLSAVREYRGVATAEPYAMLRTTDIDGTPRTALLGCEGKCGVSARIGALDGKPVIVKGTPIRRGAHTMIAVIDGPDWITEDQGGPSADLDFASASPVQDLTLRGEILDTKCWFGAMQPARGKSHKSCASLCIRGGIPPAFYVEDVHKQSSLLIMTDGGAGFGHAILEFVADPVEISGTLLSQGDLLLLDTSVAQIRRL
ncbi:MAG: hypothetical protein AAGH45_10470 [Pseudomonadota bacterium]